MRNRLARMLRRTADKLDPPPVKSPAQQGLDLINASIRRVARDTAYDGERMRLDMQHHAQIAMLGIR